MNLILFFAFFPYFSMSLLPPKCKKHFSPIKSFRNSCLYANHALEVKCAEQVDSISLRGEKILTTSGQLGYCKGLLKYHIVHVYFVSQDININRILIVEVICCFWKLVSLNCNNARIRHNQVLRVLENTDLPSIPSLSNISERTKIVFSSCLFPWSDALQNGTVCSGL